VEEPFENTDHLLKEI